MIAATRVGWFGTGAVIAGWFLVGAFSAAPDFGSRVGSTGAHTSALSVLRTKMANSVTAVTFDFRGFDTLGEEFILFASVAGASLILRGLYRKRMESGRPQERKEPPEIGESRLDEACLPTSEAARHGVYYLMIICVIFGVNLVVHAVLTPGGGFQGGVVIATGLLTLYSGWDVSLLARFHREWVMEILEALGLTGYLVSGGVALARGLPFLTNWLPAGTVRELGSGGSVNLVNFSVGVAVASAFILLVIEFLRYLAHPESGGE